VKRKESFTQRLSQTDRAITKSNNFGDNNYLNRFDVQRYAKAVYLTTL
jgi:hypothetical protein